MKLLKPTILIAGLVIVMGSTASAQLGTGIGAIGSAHNFTDNLDSNGLLVVDEVGLTGWNYRDEICRVCHVPHDHGKTQRYSDTGLLWNHALSSATYTMYSSTTMDGVIAAQPTGASKMCLGCHDGTVALDQFDRNAGGAASLALYSGHITIGGIGGAYTSDLTGTHPLSVVYDEIADPGLAPKSALMGGSGTIADVLQGDVMQCSSCHDVHDQPGESVPGTHLLRVAQTVSAGGVPSGLCLTCHIK